MRSKYAKHDDSESSLIPVFNGRITGHLMKILNC